MAEGKKTFQLTLRGAAPWISQISYEKDEKDLKLYFTLSDGELSERDIVLQAATSSESEDIVAKILPKIEFLPALGVYALWLSQDDLAEIGMGPKQLPRLCRQLSSRLGEDRGYLLFCPLSPHAYQGVLLRGPREFKQKLSRFGAQERGEWLLFSAKGTSLLEAKHTVLGTLSV